MNKLKLAHEYAMKHIQEGWDINYDVLVTDAWQYADAMQAEAEKRNKAEAAQKRKEIHEMLNAPNTFVEREGQHFDDVADCEVDWSVAPCDAEKWMMVKGTSFWANIDEKFIDLAPSFGFTGLYIVERPNGF